MFYLKWAMAANETNSNTFIVIFLLEEKINFQKLTMTHTRLVLIAIQVLKLNWHGQRHYSCNVKDPLVELINFALIIDSRLVEKDDVIEVCVWKKV